MCVLRPPLPTPINIVWITNNAMQLVRTGLKTKELFVFFIYLSGLQHFHLHSLDERASVFFFLLHMTAPTFYFFAAVIHILFFNCFVIIFVQHLCAQIESTWATTTAACAVLKNRKGFVRAKFTLETQYKRFVLFCA